jgi:hypothetical protein
MTNVSGITPQYQIDAANQAGTAIDGGDILAIIGSQLASALSTTYVRVADVIRRKMVAERSLEETYDVNQLLMEARIQDLYCKEVDGPEQLAPLLADYLSVHCNLGATPDGGNITVSVRNSVTPAQPDPRYQAVNSAMQALVAANLLIDEAAANTLLRTMGLLP